jgi:bifunctional aspartokinase / homoserine dehydrogenase 1
MEIEIMKIMKFGGSSIKNPERIKNVIEIIIKSKNENDNIAVVFSAFGGVTDELIKISKMAAAQDSQYIDLLDRLEKRHFDAVDELIGVQKRSGVLTTVKVMTNELSDVFHGVYLVKELTNKTLDFIMSFGERLSCTIITNALKNRDIPVNFLDTSSVIKTDEKFGNARVNKTPTYQNIKNYFFNQKAMQIITGFIGSTNKDEITTIGRGGSDLTASLFAVALGASELEIWTDVNGVLSADPGKVEKAFSIPEMTFDEAMEMSHFGAKVIYPPTIQPAFEEKIPIRIKNTFEPEFPGTVIQNNRMKKNNWLIKGISSIEEVSSIRIQGSGMVGIAGIAARLFGALAHQKISIILITQASSEHSICFAVRPDDAEDAKKAIEDEFALEIQVHLVDEIIVENELSIVAIVGENMRNTPGIASRLFVALGNSEVNVVAIAQGSSELNISVVLSQKDESKALNAIHEKFFNI